MKLREALQECTLALLRKIADSHGMVVDEATLRSELVEKLSCRLVEAGQLQSCLGALSSEEMELLRVVRAQGWISKAFLLDRRLPQAVRARRARVGAASSPLTSLLHKGLLYRSFAPVGDWRGEVYHVPEELWEGISAVLPAPGGEEKPRVAPREEPQRVEERNSPLDLFCLLSFLRREGLRLVQGFMSRADLAKLEREAGAGSALSGSADAERWRFLLHLCLAAGWVVRQGNRLKPGRSAARALSGSRNELRLRLLERYLRDRAWSDLAGAGRVRQALGSQRIDEASARRVVMHLIDEWAGNGWVDEDALIAAVRAHSPDFLREDYGSPSWGMVDAATEGELHGPESWDLVEGEWLRYVLRGPLYWLGIVRRGTTPGQPGNAFQLVHRYGVHADDVPREQEAQGFLRISATLEVVAPENVDLELLYRLEPYMEFVSRSGESHYRLTKASVLAALDEGGSWEELRELLSVAHVAGLPETLLRKLEKWAAEYGRYVLEAPLIIWASTPEDADRLKALPRVAPCLGPWLGPNSFRVVPERLWELLDAMKRSGLSVRVDPAVRRWGPRRAAMDHGLLKECLFALRLLHSLHPEADMGETAAAVRRLEAALGPEEAAEVGRRVRDAASRLA